MFPMMSMTYPKIVSQDDALYNIIMKQIQYSNCTKWLIAFKSVFMMSHRLQTKEKPQPSTTVSLFAYLSACGEIWGSWVVFLTGVSM